MGLSEAMMFAFAEKIVEVRGGKHLTMCMQIFQVFSHIWNR